MKMMLTTMMMMILDELWLSAHNTDTDLGAGGLQFSVSYLIIG